MCLRVWRQFPWPSTHEGNSVTQATDQGEIGGVSARLFRYSLLDIICEIILPEEANMKAIEQVNAQDARIEERPVSIRVLTIGTKQITQSLFKQLIKEEVIDDVNFELKGKVWGWVNIHNDCPGGKHLHAVWEDNGHLKRTTTTQELDRFRDSPYGILYREYRDVLEAFAYQKSLEEAWKFYKDFQVNIFGETHKFFVDETTKYKWRLAWGEGGLQDQRKTEALEAITSHIYVQLL